MILQIIVPACLVLLAFPSGAANRATQQLKGSELSAPFYYEFRGPLNEAVWEKARYTFDGNGTVSRPGMVVSGTDHLSLVVKKLDKPEEGRLYQAGGLSSRRYFSYGTFTVRMRVPTASGLVASFFLMNRWQPQHWLHQEIDIEFLGKSTNAIQFTTHKFYADSGDMSSSDAWVYNAFFNFTAGWHDYSVVWEPKRVAWLVDGRLVRETKMNVPDEPMNILMNHWLVDPKTAWGANWLGPFNDSVLPVSAEYQWVRYEPFGPGKKRR